MDRATIKSIRSKINKLEALTVARGASPSEAATAADMAQRLRAKLPEGERNFTEPPRPQGGINRDHGMGNFWRYNPPPSSFNWKIFDEAIRAFEAETYASPRHPRHPIHADTIHRMSEEDLADLFNEDYPDTIRRPRSKEEIMREYMAEKAGTFGKVKL